ncbi:MAG: hypothetical protein HRT89_12755, partial [Lentisphaeria bacterium]|nr:DUF5696 domain-containing protein [Lentisphaeria bacterium]NQZ68928.1 hypothetical protein [Lentisphaeria bacterium]
MNDIKLNSEHLQLEIQKGESDIQVSLKDQRTQQTWGPSPLALAKVYDKMERRIRTVCEFEIITFEENALGIHVSLRLSDYDIVFSLYLIIENNELVVEMPYVELYELKDNFYRLFSVHSLPELTRVSAQGSVFIPMYSGVLFSPADKPLVKDDFMIYGEQSRWELLPTLPVCAVEDGAGGLMILASQGATETACHVETDGEGSGSASFAFNLRQYWPDPLFWGTRQFRYIPFAQPDDIVHFTAKRLRRHVMDDLGKPTLNQRREESPEVDYMLGAYIMKMFHGMQPMGMMAGEKNDLSSKEPFISTLTFDEARSNLQKLKAAGVDQILTQSVGWNPRGHDGMWPSRFPIEPRLGGEKAFCELIKWGN